MTVSTQGTPLPLTITPSSQGRTRLCKPLRITVGSTQRCLQHLYIELEFRYLDATWIIVNHLPHIEQLKPLDCWKAQSDRVILSFIPWAKIIFSKNCIQTWICLHISNNLKVDIINILSKVIYSNYNVFFFLYNL